MNLSSSGEGQALMFLLLDLTSFEASNGDGESAWDSLTHVWLVDAFVDSWSRSCCWSWLGTWLAQFIQVGWIFSAPSRFRLPGGSTGSGLQRYPADPGDHRAWSSVSLGHAQGDHRHLGGGVDHHAIPGACSWICPGCPPDCRGSQFIGAMMLDLALPYGWGAPVCWA